MRRKCPWRIEDMQTNTAWGTKEKSQQANKPLSWILKDEEGFAKQRQDEVIPAKGIWRVSCAACVRMSEVVQAYEKSGWSPSLERARPIPVRPEGGSKALGAVAARAQKTSRAAETLNPSTTLILRIFPRLGQPGQGGVRGGKQKQDFWHLEKKD